MLHLPKQWYLFTLTLTTIWSRPLNSSKMDRKCARQILFAEKPSPWPSTQKRLSRTDLKTLIIDVKQDFCPDLGVLFAVICLIWLADHLLMKALSLNFCLSDFTAHKPAWSSKIEKTKTFLHLSSQKAPLLVSSEGRYLIGSFGACACKLSWTLLFDRPGSAPIWGGKKGEFRDWTTVLLGRLEVN